MQRFNARRVQAGQLALQYGIAVIGAGILGACTAYWASTQCRGPVCVIEKEAGPAAHASSRNTGVVHSPFYLNPESMQEVARASLVSRPMWKEAAKEAKIPWSEEGLLELASSPQEHKTLAKYSKWAAQNGMDESETELLDGRQVSKMEPKVVCHSALHCKAEAATDYGQLTSLVVEAAKRAGSDFIMGRAVAGMDAKEKTVLHLDDGSQVEAEYVINCAGGRALDIAHMAGRAQGYADMHFRGEYWQAAEQHRNLVRTTIYTVPRFAGYPFLDPHWIRRADGRVEVGPNAVPIPGPEVYSGYLGGPAEAIGKARELLSSRAARLLRDAEFLSLIRAEWHSSLSKGAMIRRISSFIPAARPEFFPARGTAGIRTPIITPKGQFLAGVLEERDERACHVLNYNSPGATGAPAYALMLVRRLVGAGFLSSSGGGDGQLWGAGCLDDQG